MTIESQIQTAVERIVLDLRDRSGLDNAWDGIDADIREEIIEEWETILLGAIVMPEDAPQYDLAYIRKLQRCVFELIRELHVRPLTLPQVREREMLVDKAKELIRCRVTGCGSGGACDGTGTGGPNYSCPLKNIKL